MFSKSKISKYGSVALLIIALVAINVFVTTKSMEMSQKALEYESKIKTLRQENIRLEAALTQTSSFKFIAEVAKSAGYTQDNRFMHLPAPVFAKR